MFRTVAERCSVCQTLPERVHLKKKTDAGDTGRAVRSDAQRNLTSLIRAAKEVFETTGVDAPVREIAAKAGVGLGTFYRHFPQRSDLIVAVFRHEIDACAEAANELAQEFPPEIALEKWIYRYTALIATKRGLAPALNSADPAVANLRSHFEASIAPMFSKLLEAAIATKKIRSDVEGTDILYAIGSLCMSPYSEGHEHTMRMVSLLIDGLRYKPERSV